MGICRPAVSEFRDLQLPVLILLIVGSSIGLLPKVAHSAQITLTWNANTEPDLAGYRIYQGTSSGVYPNVKDVGNMTTATVPNLTAGQTYYFAVTAYGTEGLESGYSNEVSYRPPVTATAYAIKALAVANGSISPSGTLTVARGGSRSFTVTPKSGYHIANLLVDGKSAGAVGSYTFSNVTSNRSISASFAKNDPNQNSLTMETGTAVVDQNWLRVDFQKAYSNPVVIANAVSLEDDDPAVVRIRNVDESGFEICIQEWDYLDNIHAKETVGYLVIEAGRYKLSDGVEVEAKWFETDQIDSFVSVNFDNSFQTTPIVVTSISSFNESDTVTGRIHGINSEGFKYCMQEQEANSPSHAREIVNYVAWEPSCGVLDNVAFEVGKTANNITNQFRMIQFCQSYTDYPVFIADMQTSNSMNTANVRWRNLQTDTVEIQIDEEQSADEETGHASEVVGYMMFDEL
jgi:hypothetical protein